MFKHVDVYIELNTKSASLIKMTGPTALDPNIIAFSEI